MSIYRIATPPVPQEGDGGGGAQVVHVRFAPSERLAKAARRELAEEHELKLNEIEYSEVDIRRGKSGVLEYLNAFHTQAPANYEPPGYPKGGPSTPERKKRSKTKTKKTKK